MSRRKYIYALYHGDTWITDGTKEEIAKYMNVNVRTITFYKSKLYQRRSPNSYKLILIEDYDEEKENHLWKKNI